MRILEKIRNALALYKSQGFKAVIKRICFRLVEKCPLRNTIVFECESDMDDNPRAFYEYLIEEGYNKKYRLVWIVKDVAFCKKRHSLSKAVSFP